MSQHLLKVSRLECLTDGIFAIAMTIMVLNLHVPPHESVRDIFPIIKSDLLTNLVIYIGSFAILGTHWIAMNFQWGLLDHLNRVYLWVNMYYLSVICIVPFSANLLGEYPYSVDSINFYACNLIACSMGQLFTLECAHRYKLYKASYTNPIRMAAMGRILIAPPFYIAAMLTAPSNIMIAFVLLVLPTIIYMIPGRIDRYENA